MGMSKQEALERMVPPSKERKGKPRGGVLQIWITRACDKSCYGCTQGSNLRGPFGRISLEQFETACASLQDYFGVVGIFGGNPAIHPEFEEMCKILQKYIPFERRGLWCNNPLGKGKIMRETFNPAVSNLNVHFDERAYEEFRTDWPEARPFGLADDSRHSPVYVSMRDLGIPEEECWELISRCDINQHWSAMICVYRGELRGYFCEIAGSMAMLHQEDPSWPDLGAKIEPGWWNRPMEAFADQASLYCHNCGVPLRGYGALAQGGEDQLEQTSETHSDIYLPKNPKRLVQLVTYREELQEQALTKMTDYLGNAR